jgi:predicted acylesterase/phospholipase RssA
MHQNGISDRPTLGLACAGGVVEGAIYEVGALCALEEVVDGADLHALDMYVGVSSGALIGSLLANGIPVHMLRQAVVAESPDPTLNLEPERLFSPALDEYARRLQRLPSTLVSTMAHYARNPRDLSILGLLSTFGSLLPPGFFTNAALEAFLETAYTQPGRTNDFRQLEPMLRVVAMHLDSAAVTVFGEAGHDHVPISKAIQASTALPMLYGPVEIDGEMYIDGVARRTVHASVALDAGADLLFCINPIVPVNLQMERHARRLFAPRSRGLVDHGLPAVLSQTFRAIVDSRKRTGFKKYEHTHPEADLLLIEPDVTDTSLFFSNIFSFKNRHDVCEHAYQATRRHLRHNMDTIAPMLHRHGLGLRTDVLCDRSRTLYDAQDTARLRQRIGAAQSTTTSEVLERTDRVLARLDGVLDRLERKATSRAVAVPQALRTSGAKPTAEAS